VMERFSSINAMVRFPEEIGLMSSVYVVSLCCDVYVVVGADSWDKGIDVPLRSLFGIDDSGVYMVCGPRYWDVYQFFPWREDSITR